MPFINLMAREITCKVVYYGPGLGGKTTNVKFIHDRSKPDARGKMVSLATEAERTLFFDFFPLELGQIRGFKTRFHLYTVPGQVFYDASRKLILKGLDGCVFVADSQIARADANEESLENLKEHLAEYDLDVQSIPYVVQYNKRDLPSVATVEELRAALNPSGAPDFEAVANEGVGVFETLKAVARLVFHDLKQKVGPGHEKAAEGGGFAQFGGAATPGPRPVAAAGVAPAPVPLPIGPMATPMVQRPVPPPMPGRAAPPAAPPPVGPPGMPGRRGPGGGGPPPIPGRR
jgi:hypothetical protein